MRTEKSSSCGVTKAWLTPILLVAIAMGSATEAQTSVGWIGPVLPTALPASVQPTAQLTTRLAEPQRTEPPIEQMVLGPIIDSNLDLRAGPVDVPLELKIPTLQVSAPVIGVGITAENVMDAPKGPAGDPIWHKVFWYRGSGIPGSLTTATLAGHIDDVSGRPAAFARLKELRPGDPIIVHDTRSRLDLRFNVASTETYSVKQAADPAVLSLIYGSGPVSGTGPQAAPDGLSHLTLITCSGSFVGGAYDRRLVVFATRATLSSLPAEPAEP
jgi:sortase (surface protein transpeptidase)